MQEVSAQVSFSQNFDVNSTGWTGFTRFTGTTACGGTGGSVRANLYSFATTANLVSPLVGVSSAGNFTINYSYKVANWSANTVATNPWGSFNVQYGATASGPWTTIATVTEETQNGSCISKSHTFTPPAGNLYIRFSATWSSGDYYLNFDNITLSESLPACTGTPAANNIVGTSAVCANSGTSLSLSNSYAFAGISRQWKSSLTPGGPYTNLGTATTQATGNLTATTYYVCDISCAGGDTFTTPEFTVAVNPLPLVTVSSSSPSYCNPGGTAVNLIAGGATTYIWSPATGLSTTIGGIVNATPSSTTTYTVTGTDGNGCQNIATSTVIVFGVPQSVTATATPATICVGGTSTLTAAASVPSTVNSYAFAASSGAALDPMTGATVLIGSSVDDTASASLTLPFTFNFNGVNYTTYTVSPDGWLKFGAAGTSDFSNQVTEGTNLPKLYPYWDDLATGTTGNVTGLTIGTAPNRIFVVQWFVTSPRATTGPADSTFQAWMYEGSNKVEFRYGTMGASGSASAGLTGATTQYQSITLSTGAVSTSTSNDLNDFAPVSGTSYVFTPPTATYTWSPAGDVVSSTSQTTATNALSTTQTFTVVASNNGCNGAPASATVIINPLSCSAATYTSPNCAGSDFTVTANISGGGAPYSYAWSDGIGGVYPNAATITANLPAGTYNFVCVVTDSCGSTCTSSVSVTVNGIPTVTVSPSSALYCNPSTPIALTASGAATYAWSPAAGLSATTGSVVNASPSSTTTYTVVGTDGNGCVAPAVSSAITVQPGPTPISLSSSAATVCNGTVVTLTANGGNVSTSTAFAAVGTTPIVDFVYNTSPVTVAGLPANAVISKIEVLFDVTHTWDSDVQLNLQSPNGKIVNLVSAAGGSGDNFSNTTVTSDIAAAAFSTGSAPFANGVYTASLLDLAVTNSTTNFAELFTAPFNGTWTIQTYDTAGGDTGTLNSASIRIFYSAPTTTSWTASSGTLLSSVNPDVAYVSGENAAVLYARPTTATTYAASATLGGCTSIGSTSVAVNQLPVFSVAPITICNGTTGTLVASSLESNSYSWTPVGGGTTLSGNSVMVSPSETTTYNVTATSNTTVPACSSTIQVTVTVNEPGTIVSGTASRTVSPGQLTSFEVVTTGLVTYQWQVNDNVNGWQNILAANPDYSGENTAVLSLQNITLAFDGFQYRCLVTGLAPCVTLTPIEAILNVTNTGFSTQPSDVNLCGQSSTSFSIVTTGDAPYNVQWQMSTDGGISFNDIFDGLDASGLTFSGVNEFSPKTLFVSGITTVHSGYQFKCQLDFFLDSGIATLTVNTPVTVTNNFSTTPVVRCNAPSAAATTFGISTTGSVAGVEWKYATSASGPWNTIAAGTPVGASYSGANSNTLSVTTNGSTPVGNYYYKAFVTGSGTGVNKCADVESALATVTVANPTITVSSSAATYCTPGPAVTLTASGSDINSYSWTASGFTTTTGTSVAVTPSAATTYTVTGTDANGCTNTAQATVNVGGTFSLAATSSLDTVCPGNTVSLNAVPTPLSGTSYLINSVPYQFNPSSGAFTPLTGTVSTAVASLSDDTNSASLPIGFSFNFGGTNYTNFRVNSNGLFSFGAGNTSAGNSLNSTTTGVRPGIAPLWDDLQCSSTGVTYQVSGVSPNRVLTVEWLNMEWNWSSSQNAISFQVKLYEGTNAVELVYRNEVPAGSPAGSGGASVGLMGTASTNFVSLQNLTASPTISTTTSTNNIAVKPATGQTYRFTPVAPVTYTYAWSSTPSGFTASTASTSASPSVTTTYNVTATSNAGCTAQTSKLVTVDSTPPVFTLQPVATLERCQGTTATFTATVSSATPVTYQWFKNGSPLTNGTGISGATTATLTLTGTTPLTSGSYTVTATNCSAVSSEAAVLTVYPTPTAVAPVAQVYCIDATVPATPLVGTPSGVTFDISGGASVGLPNQTGVTQIPSFNPTASGNVTITITPKANGCTGLPVTYNLIINALPIAPVLSSNSAICQDSTLDLMSVVAVGPPTILTQNFEGGLAGWTVTSASTGGANASLANFNIRPHGHASGTTFNSPGAGSFILADPDAAGSGIVLNTQLTSPSFSTVGYSAATLSFRHYHRYLTSAPSVQISTDGGTNWTTIASYSTTVGTATSFTTASVSLNAYLGLSNVKVRYNYTGGWLWYWAIDDISINGVPSTYDYAWTGPNGFTSSAQNPSIVNATPAATGDYTLQITNGNGCKSSSTISAVVYPTPTVVAPANQIYYSGFATAAIPLTGTPSGVTFNISGGAASGLADANGITTIPSFIPTATPSTVTITPVANGCVGVPVTYQIAFNPVVVNITSNICGGINHGLNNQIQAGSVSVPGYTVTGYQFEVTNTATGEVSIVQSSQSHFKLTDASNYAYGTTFTIRVAAILNGNVQGYFGNTCSLTTTTVQTSRVVTAQCGATLVFINSTINANAVNSTNLYRFRVALASAPTVTYTVERTVPNFKLTDVVGLPLLYDTEYLVDVQIRVRLAGFEAWSQYGLRCSVFTPTAPVTSLVDAQCEDYAVPSDATQINAIAFPGATAYRFRLTGFDEFGDVNYQQTVTNATPSFTLSQFTGLTPGVTYAVAVSMNLFGTFTDYGKDCSIITPSVTKQSVVEPFKATAYPNPFAANFMIDVKTTSDSVIAIKVYDMVGRLVEQKSVTVAQLENAPIGDRYPSGVYNVVITQDETVQTVRVVKR
ncbi:immunoglobulin domain-containing protein [Flavobacterium buctense]